LTGLVKKLNAFVEENKERKAAAVVIFLGKDTKEAQEGLKKLAKEHKLEIPLTINADAEVVKKYKLNEKVKNTVILYRDKKVTGNFAFDEVTEKEIQAVLKAAKENAKDAGKP
jgi:peroxiredoxin